MPVIGNLAEFPLPEVLHFIGPRTGRMKLLDVPGADYMELDTIDGYLAGLQTGGRYLEETEEVIRHLSMVLQSAHGMFEFVLLEEAQIRGKLRLPLQSLAMEMAFTVDQMNSESQRLFNPQTRFLLLQDPQMWLELELRQFFHFAREMIAGQSTLREIAEYLGADDATVASHLGKLKALGIVDIAPDQRGLSAAPTKRSARIPLPAKV